MSVHCQKNVYCQYHTCSAWVQKMIYKALLEEHRRIFFPCCYRIFTLPRMPWLEAALKIYQQYFFDICHTHFSTVLSNNTFSWIIYLKSISCQKDGDNGNLTVFWICYTDDTRRYAETSPSTYSKGDGMIQLNSICATSIWLFHMIK